MDDQGQARACTAIGERLCPFEQSLLTNQADCPQARRVCIAERPGVHCISDHAQARCLAFLELTAGQARFALKMAHPEGRLSRAKSLRVQIGGLRGVQASLTPEGADGPVTDVDGLLGAAIARFGDLERLPFQVIVQQIAAYRRPSSRKKR
ncbi:hypothetical protein ABC977_06240 [Thioalkalicoccus limnaeus]|uniref:Uncharacterized protein n=1 Tax=Thioalkalicoccus limnaeus TaxID=120681 RepID=A0ABV4BDV3_9GAMM